MAKEKTTEALQEVEAQSAVESELPPHESEPKPAQPAGVNSGQSGKPLSQLAQNLRISEMLRQQRQTMNVDALRGENQNLKRQIKRLQAAGTPPVPPAPLI